MNAETIRGAVSGEQREDRHPHVYRRIDVVQSSPGQSWRRAARRSIELSATRNCTTSAMFSSGPAEIHHRYLIRRGDERPDESGEVVVTGPGEALGTKHRSSAAVRSERE